MPWIDPELESHRLTDNLRRVTAMMEKVHDVVHEEDMLIFPILHFVAMQNSGTTIRLK